MSKLTRATLRLSEPSPEEIRRFLAGAAEGSLSYDEVGATVDAQPPSGWRVDHNRVRLGEGSEIFRRARAAVRRWEMFHLGWTRLRWVDAPIAVGTVVAIQAHTLGLHSLSACKIVRVVEDATHAGAVERFGFAYGTLDAHVARGEERFLVEWDRRDDGVWYDILAFSKPAEWFTRLGYPYMRVCQRRFGRESKLAMQRAVSAP